MAFEVCISTPNVSDIRTSTSGPLPILGGLLTEKGSWIMFDLESGWNHELILRQAQGL